MGRIGGNLLCVALLMIMSPPRGLAQDPPLPDRPQERKIDLLLSGHIMGWFPRDEPLTVGGTSIRNTDVRGTVGAGIKFDVYPWFTGKIVGAEVDVAVLGGSVRAGRIGSGSAGTEARGSLLALSTVYNLIARYPGDRLQPYVGAGIGSSTGILHSAAISGGNTSFTGYAMDMAIAYQFLGGLRAFVTQRLFVYSEYKYFSTHYSWESDGAGHPRIKLDVHTHVVSGGIGWSF